MKRIAFVLTLFVALLFSKAAMAYCSTPGYSVPCGSNYCCENGSQCGGNCGSMCCFPGGDNTSSSSSSSSSSGGSSSGGGYGYCPAGFPIDCGSYCCESGSTCGGSCGSRCCANTSSYYSSSSGGSSSGETFGGHGTCQAISNYEGCSTLKSCASAGRLWYEADGHVINCNINNVYGCAQQARDYCATFIDTGCSTSNHKNNNASSLLVIAFCMIAMVLLKKRFATAHST